MDGKNRNNRTVNIGLENVNNRIKLSCGDEYGIMKNSKAGMGTEVVIMMPLFTDIRMPGMSGLELINNLKDAFSLVLLILVSGYAEFAFTQRAVAYGAFGNC
ncbi:response regulator [Paenibacillus sp. Soil522]|uniref:response regulator n=1 Tax=Paenibacillus sp. Soil522 TaxID=1736388 RepID=UPI000A9381A9|nr:response regulator [Paenibacillus sp. Soil522]